DCSGPGQCHRRQVQARGRLWRRPRRQPSHGARRGGGALVEPMAELSRRDPPLLLDKLINPLVQVGLEKDPELPQVPLLRDLAKSPREREVLDFLSMAVAVGRPVATTPGTPPDRVAALRKAFDETLADPAFLADAQHQRLELRAM